MVATEALRKQYSNPSADPKRLNGRPAASSDHPVPMIEAFQACLAPFVSKLVEEQATLVPPHPLAAALVADCEAGEPFQQLPPFMLDANYHLSAPSESLQRTYSAVVMATCVRWYCDAGAAVKTHDRALSFNLQDAIAVVAVSPRVVF